MEEEPARWRAWEGCCEQWVGVNKEIYEVGKDLVDECSSPEGLARSVVHASLLGHHLCGKPCPDSIRTKASSQAPLLLLSPYHLPLSFIDCPLGRYPTHSFPLLHICSHASIAAPPMVSSGDMVHTLIVTECIVTESILEGFLQLSLYLFYCGVQLARFGLDSPRYSFFLHPVFDGAHPCWPL